ncbi:MAG TPA: methyltransferase domain-containing protein [Thermoleophilaceae bacterium]|nr:methyltransferase domain-containing protein [Thermoleophilaceae bacterium]
MLRVGHGKESFPLADDEFDALVREYDDVVIDLGTGDGRFVLRTARERPRSLVIGIDPVKEAMADVARRASAKPARGGVPNALFLVASAEALPEALRGRVSRLTVNYPWGSLLRTLVEPDPSGLRTVVDLLQPGGRLTALLNASVTDDRDYGERLGLPPLEDTHVSERLVPGWEESGLAGVSWRRLEPDEDPSHHTTWGRRLVRGSNRSTIVVEATRS